MNLLRPLALGAALIGALTGCGQTVVETVTTPPVNTPAARGTAVILPFADYSGGDRVASAFRRHLLITESLTDRLAGSGFAMPVQEDVFNYLVDQNIISAAPYSENRQHAASSLAGELDDPDWSDVMKDKLRAYMELEQAQHINNGNNPAVDSPGTHGLSDQEVVKIGRRFGADYVVRGRILEFRTRQEHTWDPRKRGLLPVVLGSTSRMAFGFADSEEYDSLGNSVAGGAWGAVVGNNADWPWDGDDSEGFFGLSSGQGANTIVWSVVGSEAGRMASHGGRVDQAVVRLRIWVQNAYDAQVVWTSQVEVRVAPESVLADNQYDDLFDQAVKKASASLMERFVRQGLSKNQ